MLRDSSASLADPPASSVLLPAVSWLEGTLLGTIATTVAVLAVASVGLLMLRGRIDVRRGATVVLGCFVLFGAATIVGGLQSAAPAPEAVELAPPPADQLPAPPAPPPSGYDPYAGASVPRQ